MPSAILKQGFAPENPYARDKQEKIRFLLVVTGFAAGGLVWAFFMRKKPHVVTAISGIWIIFGIATTVMKKQPVGSSFLLMGIICLAWGGVNLLKARRGSF